MQAGSYNIISNSGAGVGSDADRKLPLYATSEAAGTSQASRTGEKSRCGSRTAGRALLSLPVLGFAACALAVGASLLRSAPPSSDHSGYGYGSGVVVSGISNEAFSEGIAACAAIAQSAGFEPQASASHESFAAWIERRSLVAEADADAEAADDHDALVSPDGRDGRDGRNKHRPHLPPKPKTPRTPKTPETQKPKPKQRSRNPRVGLGGLDPAGPVLITHATLWDGDGVIHQDTDILLRNGLVSKVGKGLAASDLLDPAELKNTTIIDAHGRFVTPGIVDMHSHMGLDNWPGLNGNQDTNEGSTTRLTPQLRTLDAFNPWDPAIPIINSGGVTTSLVLPGSRNLMGGEAFAVKLIHPPSNRVEDMLLNAGMGRADGKKWRWMKMATGENPRHVDPKADGPIFPSTRLGSAFLMREHFQKAQKLLNAQNDWCVRATAANGRRGSPRGSEVISERFPTDVAFESLVALLRGDVLLNVHSYETHDLEMVVRLSHEFGFRIAAFHHALEAYEVADMIAKEDIATAIFADHFAYKREAYDASVNGAKILAEKGVKVAFKSDHPVLNAQHLIFEAAKGHHYGLSASLAIQSVTSVPAERLGQGHRIGRVVAGYDADVVIWDRNPLDIGAHPLKVFVDGHSTFEHSTFADEITKPFVVKIPQDIKTEVQWTARIPEQPGQTYTLVNATQIIASAESQPAQPGDVVVVKDGKVACIGACASEGALIDVHGLWITPGHVAVGKHLGLHEIEQEAVTSSGEVSADVSTGKVGFVPTAKDSLQIGRKKSKLLDAAFKAGITTSVSQLEFPGLAGGDHVIFRTGGSDAVDDLVATSDARDARNFAIGLDSLRDKPYESSFSGQIHVLREFLGDSANANVQGIIKVHDADNIRRIAPLLRDHDVITGGIESWKHAKRLTNKNVVLQPARCTPATWGTRECRSPSTVPSTYSILKESGVNTGVGSPDDNLIRNLIWEAGWAVADRHDANITEFEFAKESVGLVSWNLGKAYGIEKRTQIAVGEPAHFVVYDGVPGTLDARVRAVVDGDIVEHHTRQY